MYTTRTYGNRLRVYSPSQPRDTLPISDGPMSYWYHHKCIVVEVAPGTTVLLLYQYVVLIVFGHKYMIRVFDAADVKEQILCTSTDRRFCVKSVKLGKS